MNGLLMSETEFLLEDGKAPFVVTEIQCDKEKGQHSSGVNGLLMS
jgi:hypothetical protein